jgi:flavin reductase (DIM6/NTAB) family NADH-FMN oxidoreductase RutF
MNSSVLILEARNVMVTMATAVPFLATVWRRCVASEREIRSGISDTGSGSEKYIPSVELAKKVVACGNCSGRRVDKFKKFGFTQTTASMVRAPLIEECFANLECQVIDTKLTVKYNIFILEVVKAWVIRSKKVQRTIHHQGCGRFVIDGKRIQLPSKMN